MSPADRLQAAIAALAAALREARAPSMLIGGIAAIAHGVPRLTRDVDATIVGRDTDPAVLVGLFRRHRIVPRIADAEAFARQSHVLLLRHAPSGVDIDVSLAWLPFELDAIDAAVETRLGGEPVRLARPEDLVIYKVAAWRPQDRQDIERLLALHGRQMDLRRVLRLAQEIAEAIEEPDRVDGLLELIERAGLR